MENTIMIVAQHGDERAPVETVKKFRGRLNYLIANKKAYKKNVRFLESDLNRSFPGSKNGTKEERLAFNLKNNLKEYEYVVDIHTATRSTPMFLITTKLSKKHLNLAKKLGVKRLVYMNKSIASGKALIDHVRVGVSIESGSQKNKKTKKEIERVLNFFLSGESLKKQEYYVVFGFLEKEKKNEFLIKKIKAFKKVKKGEIITNLGRKSLIDFYPIMPRAKTYKGILTLIARKVNNLSDRIGAI